MVTYISNYNLTLQRNAGIWMPLPQWQGMAPKGSVCPGNVWQYFFKQTFTLIDDFYQQFHAGTYDKLDGESKSMALFLPATSNPARRADYCVHRNTASCVLSIAKRFRMLKTTCPAGGRKTPSKVRVLCGLKMAHQ